MDFTALVAGFHGAQYGAALSNPDEPDEAGRPLRFRWGFVGSSDDHKAHPGTGYKQFARKRTTDARGVASQELDRWTRGWIVGTQEDPGRAREVTPRPQSFRSLLDNERDIDSVLAGVSGRNELKSVLAKLAAKQQALIFGHAVPMPVAFQPREYGSAESYRAFGEKGKAEKEELLWD